jgi:aminopeptidase N
MYFKGSWILHTLRYLIGKEHLQTCLRRFNYPDPGLESNTDGSAIHFSNTKDFIDLVEDVSGQDLAWFFDVYLRQAALPKLVEKREGDEWTILWDVPEGHPFPMPLEIEKDGEIRKYPMNEGRLTIPVHPEQVLLDPNNWILKERRSVLLGNPYEETFD